MLPPVIRCYPSLQIIHGLKLTNWPVRRTAADVQQLRRCDQVGEAGGGTAAYEPRHATVGIVFLPPLSASGALTREVMSRIRQLIYPAPEPGAGGLETYLTLNLAGRVRFGPDISHSPC